MLTFSMSISKSRKLNAFKILEIKQIFYKDASVALNDQVEFITNSPHFCLGSMRIVPPTSLPNLLSEVYFVGNVTELYFLWFAHLNSVNVA